MNTTPSSFPVNIDIRIDWSELDTFGHVNNLAFLKYIQSARVNYWEQAGLADYHREYNTGPLLASIQCDYKKPLYYPGTVQVRSRLEFMKKSSFGLYHVIMDQNNSLSAEAKDVMVLYDFNRNEKALFPDWLRQNIYRLENKL